MFEALYRCYLFGFEFWLHKEDMKFWIEPETIALKN